MNTSDTTPDEHPALEAEPAYANAVFGDRIGLARRYIELLSTEGMVRGLIGPRELPRLWTRHVLNSAVLAQILPREARVVDVGSGAGLPGIPLALVRSDLRIDLVESLLRRTTFLSEVVDELALTGRVRVHRGRAEEAVAEVGGADVVTARAVAPLARLAEWCAPLLRPGGLFAVLKGVTAAEELQRDRQQAERAGLSEFAVRTLGADGSGEETFVITAIRSERPAHTHRSATAGRGRRKNRTS